MFFITFQFCTQIYTVLALTIPVLKLPQTDKEAMTIYHLTS